MSIPYESATAGDRAINEMQKTLAAFGCQSFGVMTDQERQILIVAFKRRGIQVHLEASWKGYAAALLKGKRLGYGQSRAMRERKALEQARVSVCSVLRDWVKGQTTAVECGVLSFETAFMPHMLLRDGRRVIDAAQGAGVLPQPDEPNIVRLTQESA